MTKMFVTVQSIFLFFLEKSLNLTESGLEIIEDSILPFCSKWVENFTATGRSLVTTNSNRLHSGQVIATQDPSCAEGSTQSPTPAQGPEFLQDFNSTRSRESDVEDILIAAKQLQQVWADPFPNENRKSNLLSSNIQAIRNRADSLHLPVPDDLSYALNTLDAHPFILQLAARDGLTSATAGPVALYGAAVDGIQDQRQISTRRFGARAVTHG